ncbi:MAG: zinc transport system permease protein [Cocleimonas sp.]|jgi:zinc transport system permease protein
MDDFLIRALLAGLLIAIIAGPLGVFILWRRMAYFGDTLSHSAILGVALGLLLSINVKIGILLSTLLVAALLIYSQRQKKLASDTMLGIISHSALSLGLVLISFVEGVRVDIESWLFGDILAVSWNDIAYIAIGVAIVITVLLVIWKPLLSLTVHEELALVEGVNVSLISAIYTLLIAVLVAIAMKIVGALLITALLIIPAATSRQFARTPEQMALFSIGFGMLAVIAGLFASFLSDTPAGPSIVVSATVLFLMSQIFKKV